MTLILLAYICRLLKYMLLNIKYYQDLWSKYQNVSVLSETIDDKSLLLTLKLILDAIDHMKPIHFNFQNNQETLYNIGSSLFVELANIIFRNAVDYPNYKINDILRSKAKISKKNLLFVIEKIEDGRYSLKCRNRGNETLRLPLRTYEKLIDNFTPVTQNVRDHTLKRFYDYFKDLNNGNIYEFEPTDFTQKCVFIAPKIFWEGLKVKNKIPCIYMPNHRDESNEDEIKSIPAIFDCMMYVTSRYETCYQSILSADKIINTIVVLDCEENRLEQIVSDKSRFNFNLVVLTNLLKPDKFSSIPMWNWFKEEIDIINSL